MDEGAPVFPDAFNMADYFVFANLEAGRGDKPAILFEGRTITYAEVARNVERVAHRLLSDGLLPEQRVLLCMRDCPEFVYAWFGALKAGAVVTQINPLLPETDYRYYLGYVKPQFAFIDEASLAAFGAAAAESRHGSNVILVGEDATFAGFDDWLARDIAPGTKPWPTRKDDPAVWLFTSGTTGQSKGAVHCHFHFAYNTEVYARRFIGVHEDDVTLSGPRLFFGYATGTNLMFPFAVGATTILFRDPPTAQCLFDQIERHRPTILTNVPTLINKMLEADGTRPDLSSLRFMWSAGEALPRELHERWDRAFGVPIIDGIGSAESFHIYISNRPDDIRPGSLGRLVPGYEARLIDDEGQPVEQGDIGTLWIGGDSAALYYHGDYAKSKEHLRGGWIVSGDKFRQDADGYWHYEGRGDDLIKSGGIYVSPIEVENCLTRHEAVSECCVVGRKDAAGLEKPVAIVVLKAGIEKSGTLEAELIDFSRQHLARYKAPHRILFADAALPRNDRDKIDRKALKARVA
ncbi:benzoate-CoA ligase family protein [Sphingomonas cavernae]|uniref:Benzoate-CoA ligase family protein n=1 Tax=Sphingomonas cavernae TaxID=2320861 RepID=A0A418W7D5_9SPHN|nr:benzoate-CoA ligase family protein [Sphingomonas cavernae]RJF85951.1 benzoate-CoA ligase family protein [Sphingomonas cavernae]